MCIRDSGQNGVGDESRIAHLGELHQPGAVGEPTCEVPRNPNTEPCLADTTRPDKAHQAGSGQLPSDLGKLMPTADEGRRVSGQVAGPAASPRHPEYGQPLWSA